MPVLDKHTNTGRTLIRTRVLVTRQRTFTSTLRLLAADLACAKPFVVTGILPSRRLRLDALILSIFLLRSHTLTGAVAVTDLVNGYQVTHVCIPIMKTVCTRVT